jgi:DNA-binding NtrC family response regulator
MQARTVLVAEDDDAILQLLVDALRNDGYEVISARDGLRAIRAVDEVLRTCERPRIVLLDMLLPRVDGLGVLQHMAAHHDDVPVVAMSGSAYHLRLAEAERVPAVLPKPLDLKRVLDLVDRYSRASA